MKNNLKLFLIRLIKNPILKALKVSMLCYDEHMLFHTNEKLKRRMIFIISYKIVVHTDVSI